MLFPVMFEFFGNSLLSDSVSDNSFVCLVTSNIGEDFCHEIEARIPQNSGFLV